MKQEEFEHTLKQLTDDFSLPVSNAMFDAVMEKRSKQHRRKKVLGWMGGCIMAALLFVCALFYFNPGTTLQDGQAVLNTTGSPAPMPDAAIPAPDNGTNNVDETTGKSIGNKPVGSVPAPSSPASLPSSAQTSRIHTKEPAQARVNAPVAETTASNSVKTKIQNPQQPAIKERLPKPAPTGNASGLMATAPKAKDKASLQPVVAIAKQENPDKAQKAGLMTGATDKEQREEPPAANVSAAEQIKAPETKSPETGLNDVVKKEPAPVPMIATAVGQPDSSAAKPAAAEPAAPKVHKWAIGLYGDYTPVSSARNCNAVLPLPASDSLGLSDRVDYVYTAGLKFGYSISDRWKVSIGLGYHKMQFDKVRFAPVKIDTSAFEQLTGNYPNKSTDVTYAFNISDHSFSWIQVPVSVTYVATPQKRVSFYAEAGMVYQALIQSKGYELATWNGNLKYKEVKNQGENRVTQNQFAWFVEPGVKVNITPRINYQLGIIYRRHLTALYKKSYIGTNSSYGPASYMGLSSSINFIF